MGRQISALKAGGYTREAIKVYDAAIVFISNFGYGDSGRTTLASVFRMGKLDDTTKSIWMESR